MVYNTLTPLIEKSSLKNILFSTILLPPQPSVFSPNARVPAQGRNPPPSKVVVFIVIRSLHIYVLLAKCSHFVSNARLQPKSMSTMR